MKNFSKKLSFVMATAMVVTSLYAPQNAEAAAKNVVVLKGSTKAVKSKNIYLSGKTVDFDAMIKGKKVKDSAGKWTSSNKKVATVNKNGVVKVTGAGTATIKFTDKKSKKTASVKIYGRVRAAKMMLTPAAVMVKEGESADVAVSYELSKKVQAAGGKATTYKLFAESSDEKFATVSVDGNNKVMVKGVAKSASPVSITVYAAQVNDLAKAKKVRIKLTEKFDVKVSSKLEAKQAGANKIKVMGSDFVASKGAFVVKNSSGVVLPLKDEVKLNEAKTEAVLEGDTTQIPVGKYTLSYNNSDPVEFEVVKAVVKRIEIMPTGTAIMARPTSVGDVVKEAYAFYRVFDQFGEDVTKNPISSRIQVSGSDNARAEGRGKIKFTTSVAGGYQLNLSKISVAVVDLDTGVNTSAILTTGEASKVWETEYKGLYNITTRKYVENINDADKLANYVLIFSAKDQYGTSIVSSDTAKQIQVNLLGITGVITDGARTITIGDDDYYAFPLKNATSTTTNTVETASREGEVTVQTIVVNNGKTETKKFNVVASSKVDTLNVRAGALGVYAEQNNWLDFTALDANGKEITSWDVLSELNSQTYIKNYPSVKFAKKSDGKVGLLYSAGPISTATDTGSVTQVLTFVTKTNKFSTANIAVRAKRHPISILGLVSGTTRGTTSGQALGIKAEKIRFQDQYGNNMTADDIKGEYKVAVTLENESDKAEDLAFKFANRPAAVVSTSQAIDLAGNGTMVVSLSAMAIPTKSAISKVTLSLLEKKGSNFEKVDSSEDRTFEVYNARLKDMSSFAIEDPGLRAAYNLDKAPADLVSQKGFEPSVIGYYAGEKISLAKVQDYTVYGASPAGSTFAPVPSVDDEKDTAVKKAIVRVIINDNKPTTVEREFSYSREARKVNKTTFDNTTIKLASVEANWTTLAASFGAVVKDQYDDKVTDKKPYVTFTDFTKEDGVTVKKNGTTDTTIAISKDVTLTIKLAFPGSSYVFEKVVTLEK